jgi:hypothetical protein
MSEEKERSDKSNGVRKIPGRGSGSSNGAAAHSQSRSKEAEDHKSERNGSPKQAASRPRKEPVPSLINAHSIILVILVVAGAFCVFRKQGADAQVALCAQRHERGEYEEALRLCHEALSTYHQLNELTKHVGWKDGLLWGDVAQTTVRSFAVSMFVILRHNTSHPTT